MTTSRHEALRREVDRAHATTAEPWPWFTPGTVGGLLDDIAVLEAEVRAWRRRYEDTAAALRKQSRMIVKARREAERRVVR